MKDSCDAMGGDPPCWAHLLDDELATDDRAPGSTLDVVDLAEVAAAANAAGVAWSRQSEDLNVNLVVFGPGEGVDAHVNAEVDLLIVVLAGDGTLVVEGIHRPLRANQTVVIPKGANRKLRASSQGITYLTCHRRRSGLWPSRRGASSAPGDLSTA